MISNQILQNTLNGLKNITKTELSIIDREGNVIVSTELDLIGETIDSAKEFLLSPAESMSLKGYQYFKAFDSNTPEYVIIAKGEDVESFRVGQITAFQTQNLLVAYKERYDKDNFIKNLLLDNLLLVDIYGRAKKMNIENNVGRMVFLIEINEVDNKDLVEKVHMALPITKSKDFVTSTDEKSVIVVREMKFMDKDRNKDMRERDRDRIRDRYRDRNGDIQKTEQKEDVEQIAKAMQDSLENQLGIRFRISIGRCVHDLKHVSLSYKEAKMALEVGRIFYTTREIINYEELGIGRLIYQLPATLCNMFMEEILGNMSLYVIDEEIMSTVLKFFENNLNISETSRNLYIHRNTLVYRLDKLQKITNLDMRNFEDAVLFKVLLMVSKYMNYKKTCI